MFFEVRNQTQIQKNWNSRNFNDNINNKCNHFSFNYTRVWIWIAIAVNFKIAIAIATCCTRNRTTYHIVLRNNLQPYTILTIDGHESNTHQTSHEINSSLTDQFSSNDAQSVNYPSPPYSIKYWYKIFIVFENKIFI